MLIVAALSTSVACCAGTAEQSHTTAQFTGVITEFVPRSLLELDSIEVTDESGTARSFHAAGRSFGEFTPSHVREHMLLGQGVVVTYTEDDGRFIIQDLEDAPSEQPGPS